MTTIPTGNIPQPVTPPSGASTPRLPLSPRARQVLSNRPKPLRLASPVSIARVTVPPRTELPRTAPTSGTATPRSGAPSTGTTPRAVAPQSTTPTPDRLPRSASIEQRIAGFRRSASPSFKLRRSITKGGKPEKPVRSSDKDLLAEARPLLPEKLSHAERVPKEHASGFVVPEKRQPRKKRNNTDIIEGLKSLKRKILPDEPKVPLARRETAELAMQKRGSVREHAKFFEEQARLVHTERHPVRRSHTEKPAASTLSNVPRRETLLGGLPVDPRDRMRGARPERRDSGEKLQSTIRKTDNFS